MTKVKTRRQLGISFRSVRSVLKELRKTPGFDPSDSEGAAIAVLDKLIQPHLNDPGIDWEDIDWDELFEFILKIVELFMTIFSMF